MSPVRGALLFASLTAIGCAVDVSGLPADGSVDDVCTADDRCSDGIDCTDDTCNRDGVCVHTEVDTRCASGEVCIADTGCQPESACTPAECADALRVELSCQVGACQPDGTCLSETTCAANESCCGDGTCMACDDGNPCTEDSCDSGGCVHTPLDGTPCDDGDFCTGTEVCVAGTCESSGDPCAAPTVCNVDRCVGCRNDGDCPDDTVPPYGACEYSDTCDQRAVRRRTVTSFTCQAEECIGADSEQTDDCTRDTNGNSCGSDSVGGWSGCSGFSNTCDETGTRSRDRTTFTCNSGSCDSATSTETGSCSRDTDGTMCQDTDRPAWGDCGEFSTTNDCDETGVQRRTVTTYSCAGGSCDGTPEMRMQACTRDTDGMTGCGTPMADDPGPCEQTNPGTCDEAGTRVVTSYGTVCAAGTCEQVPSMRTEACVFDTDGNTCSGSGACAGECSGGSCDMNANDGTVCAGSGPCASECNGGTCDANANDGATCDDGISCTTDGTCNAGTCDRGGDDCANGGSGPCGSCGGGSNCDCIDSAGDGSWACGCT